MKRDILVITNVEMLNSYYVLYTNFLRERQILGRIACFLFPKMKGTKTNFFFVKFIYKI